MSGSISNGYNYCLGTGLQGNIENVVCPGQNWTVSKSSRSAGYQIGTKNCVTAAVLRDGENLQLASCGKVPAAQQDWVALPSGGIALVGSNFCLDVEVGVPKPNSPIQIYTCQGLTAESKRIPSQRWGYNPAMFRDGKEVAPVATTVAPVVTVVAPEVTLARPNRDLLDLSPPTTVAVAENPTAGDGLNSAPSAPTSFSISPGFLSNHWSGYGWPPPVFWTANWNASPGATKYQLEVSRLKNPLTGKPRGTKNIWDVQYISTSSTTYRETKQEFKYQNHAVLRVGVRACNLKCSEFVYSETEKLVPRRDTQRNLLMLITEFVTADLWYNFEVLRSASGKHVYFPYADWTNDGCSNSPDFPGANFILACSMHDWLYRNSKRLDKERTSEEKAPQLWNDKNRKIFDDQFLFLLQLECNNLGTKRETDKCLTKANVYYQMVRKCGGGKFKSACLLPWKR